MFEIFLPILIFIIFLIDKSLTEKWHDKRTKRHRFILCCLIGSQGILCIGTGISIYRNGIETYKLTKNIAELIDGKNELIRKVTDYQIKNQELELKIRKQARGILSFYDFDGARREMNGGYILRDRDSPQIEIGKKMFQLQEESKFKDLVELCEAEKIKTPEWLTPYLLCGIAYANTGNHELAIENIKYVTETAPGDPSYQQATELLRTLESSPP
jgi:hypothetical protein